MKDLKLTFINVGYGEAILLQCPDPSARGGVFTMLIDGGSAEPEEFADRSTGRIPMVEFLERRGLDHIDCMVATHIHEDHICGLLSVAGVLPPAELWQTLPIGFCSQTMRPLDEDAAQTDSQRKFLRALNDYQVLCGVVAQAGGRIRFSQAGQEGTLCQGLSFQVLAPTPTIAKTLKESCEGVFRVREETLFLENLHALNKRMNNYSLILRLEYGGVSILLPGDTNCLGYGEIPRKALRSQVFKVGHHGQKDGAAPELMEAIRPEAVICCASSDRRYESADPQVMRMIAEQGAKLYFSDCPALPGLTDGLAPHQALEFTITVDGTWQACYRNE